MGAPSLSPCAWSFFFLVRIFFSTLERYHCIFTFSPFGRVHLFLLHACIASHTWRFWVGFPHFPLYETGSRRSGFWVLSMFLFISVVVLFAVVGEGRMGLFFFASPSGLLIPHSLAALAGQLC